MVMLRECPGTWVVSVAWLARRAAAGCGAGPSVFGAGGAFYLRVCCLSAVCCQWLAGTALAAGFMVTAVSVWVQAGLLRMITAMRPNAASSSA